MLRQLGFTMIEMMVVLAVLSVLALATFPVAEMTARRAREVELRSSLTEIRSALDAYRKAFDEGRILPNAGRSGYPPTLETLVAGEVDARDPGRGRMYFLRRIPRDPFREPDTKLDAMWGLRSYASPPDRPAPGADVFDVYSLSPGVGLNGVPYRDW